jgi:hypothetical protein
MIQITPCPRSKRCRGRTLGLDKIREKLKEIGRLEAKGASERHWRENNEQRLEDEVEWRLSSPRATDSADRAARNLQRYDTSQPVQLLLSIAV